MVAMYLGHSQAIDKESDVQTNIEKSEDEGRIVAKEFVGKAFEAMQNCDNKFEV